MKTSAQPGLGRPQLKDNVVFQEAFDSDAAWEMANSVAQPSLSAYDNAGRLYIWNPERDVMHYVNVDRDVVSGSLSTLPSAEQEEPFDTLDPTPPLNFPPVSITISRNGRYVALVGEAALAVLDTQSTQDTGAPDVATCIVHRVAANLYSGHEGSRGLLQVAWHPGSDTHLGCLSSDGLFRLFDLSQDKDSPEQEYYLQRPHGRSPGFTQPVDFVFGGEHLWEKFTVFFLWSDGAIFPLCPVVPFGSLYSLASISSLFRDMEQAASQASPEAEATLAWLQEVFPQTERRATSPPRAHSKAVRAAAGMVAGARAHVPYDCSPALQGPLPLLGPALPPLGKGVTASSLVCSTSGKDSLLGWALSDGSLHVAVLTDEVLPTWNRDHILQTQRDIDARLLSATMVAEAADVARPGWPIPPPLLPLASVDLALSPAVLSRCPLTLIADPLVPERFLCRHGRGVDAVTLRWLPFSDAAAARAPHPTKVPPPDVVSLLDAREDDGADVHPLMGLAVVSDSGGDTWVVATMVGGRCVVASVRSHAPTALPALSLPGAGEEGEEATALSPDLAHPPTKYRIPQAPPGPALTTASHSGRLFLHQQCKALRERYIEYAHRVHVELTSRAARLEEMVREQRRQLEGARQALAKADTKADAFAERVAEAHAKHKELEQRLQQYSKLPSVSRTPLTAMERTYRTEIVGMAADLPLLHSTLSGLMERAEELGHGRGNGAAVGSRPPRVPDAQMARLKQAVERSTGVVSGMLDKVHLLEESVHRTERHAVR